MRKKNQNKGKIKAIKQNESGRNIEFEQGNRTFTDKTFVKEIKQGDHKNHHIRVINNVPTPVSNPDGNKNNNLE